MQRLVKLTPASSHQPLLRDPALSQPPIHNHMSYLTGRISLWSTATFLALQLPVAAQIPNEGFESWTDCLPDHWSSPNVCGVFTPVTRSSTANSGSWAARGEVVSFFGQTIQPLLQSGETGEGIPISQRHATLDGVYLFSPLGGDRFAVNVAFY